MKRKSLMDETELTEFILSFRAKEEYSMSKQNIYDNDTFFEHFRSSRENEVNLVLSIVLRKLLLNRLDYPTPDRTSAVKGAMHLSCP